VFFIVVWIDRVVIVCGLRVACVEERWVVVETDDLGAVAGVVGAGIEVISAIVRLLQLSPLQHAALHDLKQQTYFRYSNAGSHTFTKNVLSVAEVRN